MQQRLIRQNLLAVMNNHIVDYPTPLNITYFWSFGSLAGFCLIIQILTGIFLAMHYIPHINYAFASVEHIMRDVNNGWFLRYLHANGASMFFIIIYIHIFRGMYYGSYMYPRQYLWLSGVLIFLLMMATGFLGYVLPWGQMSFWGATVITNLFGAIPVVGKHIVLWLWGGFSVDNPTLNRFFSLHYLLPFVIAGLALIHLILLHQNGSNNPLGTDLKINTISFFPYFYFKDLASFLTFLTFFMIIVFYSPNMLGDPDNYIFANPSSTPEHIVPEWYFLPFYAILRSIPDKLFGVIAMFSAIILWALLPFLTNSSIRSPQFRPIFNFFFWIFFFNFIILGWIGQQPAESPYIEIGQISSLIYLIYFIIFMPILGKLETFLLK